MAKPGNQRARAPRTLRWLALPIAVGLAACGAEPQSQQAPPPAPTPPMARETPPPDYPPEYACRRVGGTTVLDVALAANGLPVRVGVAASSGNRALDDLALAAVKTWKFRPATLRGQPTTSRLQVPVTFTPPNPPPDECNQYL